ncbi:hypothetical protein BGX21_005801, partial [Mortierella sp. AD011]
MSHQRASSTSSISTAFDTHVNSNNQSLKRGMANPAGNSSTPVATPSSPLSVSIPRQRSFSSSLSSRGAFTGSSIIANPSNGFLNSPGAGATTPFSAAFNGPLASPTSASFSSATTPATTTTTTTSSSLPSSQTVPVLHRRFSSSFNQLNHIVGPPSSTQ